MLIRFLRDKKLKINFVIIDENDFECNQYLFLFLTEQVDKSTAECVEDGEHVSDSERSRKFAAVVAQSE